MKARIKIDRNWLSNGEKSLDKGLLEMTTDIHTRSGIIVAKDTRALLNSGIIEKIREGYRIKYGNARVPYARKRYFENKKTPSSLKWLEKAADSVSRGNTSKYFRNKGL